LGRKPIRELRRKEILDALFRCLLKKPYSETTVKDIGEEAGINHAMLHYYFKSKEDILISFIDSIYEQFRLMYELEAAKIRKLELTSSEVLRRSFSFMNNEITTDKNLQTIFVKIWEIALSNPAINARVKKFYNEWIEELAKIIKSASSLDTDANKLAMAIVAFQEGIGLFTVFFNMKKKDSIGLMEAFQDRIIEMIE